MIQYIIVYFYNKLDDESKEIAINLLNDIDSLHLLCKNIVFSTSCYINGLETRYFLDIIKNINSDIISIII